MSNHTILIINHDTFNYLPEHKDDRLELNMLMNIVFNDGRGDMTENKYAKQLREKYGIEVARCQIGGDNIQRYRNGITVVAASINNGD